MKRAMLYMVTQFGGARDPETGIWGAPAAELWKCPWAAQSLPLTTITMVLEDSQYDPFNEDASGN